MGSEMDTFTARLASFDTVLKPERRRSSTTKSSKAVAWPHQKPSPAELAHAGFYYKPYESNPDNTTCFECGRALDGWEEEDNPVEEHLKHSPDCGWAIIVDIQQKSSNPATIEDPTSDKITQARLATFGSAWPHDGKRGWVCQSEKMVAGGWYFCPTDESDDLASCPYCKLSLDGWEPKDDPFDEHYRRSSDCSFFVFAQPPAKKGKGSKAKKSRTSKASSRLSTQSVATTTSEAPEMDIDEAMDQSIMSHSTAKGKPTKKTAKSKGKTAKSKKEDKGMEEADSVQLEEPEPVKPKRTGRSKKRASEEMADEEPNPYLSGEREEIPVEPPAKRRDTKTREGSISEPPQADSLDYEMPDTAPEQPVVQEEEPPKKGRKGAKKRTSKMRKGSDASIVSASVVKDDIPQDAALDAALEAGLEADEPKTWKHEAEPEPEQVQAPPPKKTKSSKKAKAPAKPVNEALADPEDSAMDVEPPVEDKMDIEDDDVDMVQEPPKTKSSKGSKKKGTKKSKKDDAKTKEPAIEELSQRKEVPDDQEHEHHESFVSVEIVNRNSEPGENPETIPEPELEPAQATEPEEEIPKKLTKKKASQKDEKPKKSKKTKKQEPSPPREPEPEPEPEFEPEPEPEHEPEPELVAEAMHTDPDPMSPSIDGDFGTPDELPDQVEIVAAAPSSPAPQESSSAKERTPVPPKTAKRFSDIPHEEHYADLVRQSLEPSDSQEIAKKSPPTPALPPSQHSGARQSTPSMSPQSSDAENRPPSSRPSASRQIVPSVSIEPQARTPLAAKTPSPSKRNFNGGFAASGHPWTPVDIDEALFGDRSDDKENTDLSGLLKGIKGGLTSPEKKMSVEEWIHWNAKNGEERLKRECERLVGQFEKEGGRAMQRLEAIECLDS